MFSARWSAQFVLKFGGLGGAGEGDDVADVGHAGDEENFCN